MILSDVGRGNLLGISAVIPEDNKFVLNQRVALLRTNDDVDSYFLSNYINYHQNYFKVHGIGMSQLNISKSTVQRFKVYIPTFFEQNRIGKFFQLLDSHIKYMKYKIELLKLIKKAFLQKLFVKNNFKCPEIRFKEFTDTWEKEVLINIVDRVIRKNKNSQEELVLTISADHGIISQLDFFNKSVSGKDLSGYYLIKRGEFAYNKSYSNGYPFGVIKRLDNYPQGLLSSLYIIFSPKHTVIDSNYLLGYYQTTYWHKEILKISTEGARNHGLLNISIHDFFNTQLIITNNIAEQEKIGIYIQNVEKLISLYQRKLELLELMKKGFLQKMFV